MRRKLIDQLRGLAFIMMLYQHIYVFEDLANQNMTSHGSSQIVEWAGIVSRNLFIILAGISIGLSASRPDFTKKRWKRSMAILAHAFVITLVSFLVLPDAYIRFGVLHFMAIGTLIAAYLADKPGPLILVAGVLVLIQHSRPHVSLGPLLDTVLGLETHYPMIDYFPLIQWLPILLSGVLLKDYVPMKELSVPWVEWIGQNSLNLYTIHMILLFAYLQYRLKSVSS